MPRKQIIEPHRSIADIDRDIRANRLALLRRQKVRRMHSAATQGQIESRSRYTAR